MTGFPQRISSKGQSIEGYKACIIGAGISGICAAVKLQQAGIEFEIMEKLEDIGGTWLINNYPAAGCDVPTAIYQYSFNKNTNWSAILVKRDEIMKYLNETVDKYSLRTNISFKSEIKRCIFDSETQKWSITVINLKTGETTVKQYNFLFKATGQLNQPKVPDVSGSSLFQGEQFHTSQWNHNVDFQGKRVIAVGTGPSAIQAYPEVFKDTSKFSVVYRSGTFFLSRKALEANHTKLHSKCLKYVPYYKSFIYSFHIWFNDIMYNILYTRNRKNNGKKLNFRQKQYKKIALRKLNKDLPNTFKKFKKVTGNNDRNIYQEYKQDRKQLKQLLTPDIIPGCKRSGFSSKWFQMFAHPNVDLVQKEIVGMDETGMLFKDKNGIKSKIEADVIIWATGFHTIKMSTHFPIISVNRDKREMSLSEKWKDGAIAFKGTLIDDFPNLFILYGPNTNPAHNSVTYMVERQVEFSVNLIKKVIANSSNSVMVKTKAVEEYNLKLSKMMERSVYSASCSNWYQSADGKVPTNWPSTVRKFKKMTKKIENKNYVFR